LHLRRLTHSSPSSDSDPAQRALGSRGVEEPSPLFQHVQERFFLPHGVLVREAETACWLPGEIPRRSSRRPASAARGSNVWTKKKRSWTVGCGA
jgi:hypothetical protein